MPTRFLLVGWEVADWRLLHPLIDSGHLPNLRRVVEEGASGQLLSSQPQSPVVQWINLATGKRPWQHGISHALEKTTGTNQFMPVIAKSRRSLAIWELLARVGKRTLAVGWPATQETSHPGCNVVSDRFAQPTAGPGVKPWPPAAPGTYWPESMRSALDGLRVSPADIQSDAVDLCLPQWRQVDQSRDRTVGNLRVLLATDLSHAAAALHLLPTANWDFVAVRFPGLGPITPMLLNPSASYPEKASKAPGLNEKPLSGALQLYDRILGQLLQAAGRNAAALVASAHGWSFGGTHAETAAPRGSRGRLSAHGILAAWGPRWAKDSLLFGATVFDVAPTILSWFDLPIGEDMEGRVLVEGFAQPPEIGRVPSWETSSAGAASERPEPASSDNIPANAALRRETDWNLAQSFLEAGRLTEALPLLQSLFRAFPEAAHLGLAFFQCQLALRQSGEAAQTLEILLESLTPGVWPLLCRAELHAAEGRFKEARAAVAQVLALNPAQPDAMRRLGLLLLRLRQWEDLGKLAQKAIELDENEPLAWLALAEWQLRTHAAPQAEVSALRAIALNYYLADAHFVLARALVARGEWQRASEAIQTLLKLQPGNRRAAGLARRLPLLH